MGAHRGSPPALRRTGRADVVGAEGANSSLVGDARVIFVASAGALTERLETTDVEMCPPRAFDGTRQYAKNKRQQLALVERWARAEPDVGFFAMHPGWADTAALRAAMPAFRDALAAKLRTPREGADTVAWLCVASRDDLKSGGFTWTGKSSHRISDGARVLGTKRRRRTRWSTRSDARWHARSALARTKNAPAMIESGTPGTRDADYA